MLSNHAQTGSSASTVNGPHEHEARKVELLSYYPICPNVSTEAVPPPRQTQDNCALPLKVITYLLCYIQIVIYYITRTLY